MVASSASRLAYSDAFELMDLAIADDKGTRIKFSDYGTASHFRMRIHQARQIDRRENSNTYEMGHPMWGRSPYDVLRASIRQNGGDCWLYLIKRNIDDLTIESLSEVDGEDITTIEALSEIETIPQSEPATNNFDNWQKRFAGGAGVQEIVQIKRRI